jgi:hypothetical protein
VWAIWIFPGACGGAVNLLDVLVHAGLVGGALDERRPDVRPLDPFLDVVHEELRDLVGIPVHEELRQVVVGVDPGAGDHLKPCLLRDAAHELDVAAKEHRGGLADRLDAEVHRCLRLAHRDLQDLLGRDLVGRLLLDGADVRPLIADRLVRIAKVLVDQRRAELIGLDHPRHRRYLRHGARTLFDDRRRWDTRARCH